MEAEILLKVGLPVSLGIIMFSLGLELTFNDFTRVFRRPLAFSIGAVNQIIVLPLVAFALATFFELPPMLAVGMMILAFCPGGVTTGILTKLAKGDVALSVSLTGVISLLSVITMPPLIAFAVGLFMGTEPVIDVSRLALQMFLITAAPVLLGVLLRHYAGWFTMSIDRLFSRLATLLFVIIIAATLYSNWQLFIANLLRLGPALIALNIALMMIGWGTAKLLKMPKRAVTAIAIETGIQNGTLGIAVGSLIAESATGLPPFSLPSAVYGILMYGIAIPFIAWRRMGREE